LIGQLERLGWCRRRTCRGRADHPVRRAIVPIATGTNGGAAAQRTYYEHGIHTILRMFIDDRDLRELEALQHPPANPAIAALEQRGLEVISGSGVIRV
jgi:hypothetical protein